MQRDEVARRLPGSLPRTFTLREFVRLASAASDGGLELPTQPTERIPELVRAAHRTRPLSAPGGSEDVADPMGRPLEIYRRLADELDPLITTAADLLFGG